MTLSTDVTYEWRGIWYWSRSYRNAFHGMIRGDSLPLWMVYRNELIHRLFHWYISKFVFLVQYETVFVFGFPQARKLFAGVIVCFRALHYLQGKTGLLYQCDHVSSVLIDVCIGLLSTAEQNLSIPRWVGLSVGHSAQDLLESFRPNIPQITRITKWNS